MRFGPLLVLAYALLVSQPAGAESARTPALEHFNRGSRAFDLGRFEEAVREFEAAYEITDDPNFLFNIAQAHRHAGHIERSVFFFRTYLHHVPHAENRRSVERTIARLELQLKEMPAAPSASPALTDSPARRPSAVEPPSATTPTGAVPVEPVAAPRISNSASAASPPPASPRLALNDPNANRGRSRRLAGVGLMVAGGAALIGAVTASLLAGQAANRIMMDANAGRPFDPATERAGRTEDLLGAVLYGVGAAAVLSGSVLYVLGRRARPAAEQTQIRTSLGLRRGGATLGLALSWR